MISKKPKRASEITTVNLPTHFGMQWKKRSENYFLKTKLCFFNYLIFSFLKYDREITTACAYIIVTVGQKRLRT